MAGGAAIDRCGATGAIVEHDRLRHLARQPGPASRTFAGRPETPRMAPRPAATANAAGLLPHSSGPVVLDGPDGCEPEWPPSRRGVARQSALILCQPSQPLGLLDRVESSPLSE